MTFKLIIISLIITNLKLLLPNIHAPLGFHHSHHPHGIPREKKEEVQFVIGGQDLQLPPARTPTEPRNKVEPLPD